MQIEGKYAMSSRAAYADRAKSPDANSHALTMSTTDLVLIRIASAPATRTELQRDLTPILSPPLAYPEAKKAIDAILIDLRQRQSITEARSRFSASAKGADHANMLLTSTCPSGWSTSRATLAARAFEPKSKIVTTAKALERPDGLASFILQNHFKITGQRLLSSTTLRAELAVIALERAFGNRIKTGLGKNGGLPGKAGRVLAGQLFDSQREFSSDSALIVALAADVVGADDATHDAIVMALLRRALGTPATQAHQLDVETAPRPVERSPRADNDLLPLASPLAYAPPTPEPPDMREFTGAVVAAARPVSNGWPGNRKAFISLVWQAIRNTRPDWGLTEIAFKSMLAEAHRSGQLMLATADLKDRVDRNTLEASKVLYKNTVWHFVRVED
jgi:hypothetical protein